jgi:hypothetical protein
MRTKRGGIKTCLVVVAVFISLFGIVSMAEAGYFGTAEVNLFASAYLSALAMNFGNYGLYLAGWFDVDTSILVYYAYIYMGYAKERASTAYNNAYYGAYYNYNGLGSLNESARDFAYDSWDYKNQTWNNLYNIYLGNEGYIPDAIENAYQGDSSCAAALWFVGLVSIGGRY